MRLQFSFWVTLVAAQSFAAETNIGWRNDGTGKFPDADPPVTWSRTSNSMLGVRFQADKPADGAAGKPMPDGVIREWLMLAPVAIPDVPKAAEKNTLPNELELAPGENEKCGELIWKKISVDSGTVDFVALLGGVSNSFAYLHAYLYSENGGEFCLQFTHRKGGRIIFNGKHVFAGEGTEGRRANLQFQKGWNRLLLKIGADEKHWFGIAVLHSRKSGGYEDKNIAWRVPLPGARVYFATPCGPGAPIVVGDKIFLMCEPHDLFCLEKQSGKILWIRSNSYFDALTEAERAANSAFKEVEPLAEKWNAQNAEIVAGKTVSYEAREKLEKELYETLKKTDEKRFKRPGSQDVGYAGFIPASDGQFVYVWLGSGVTACYDLDGNRKWIRIDNHETVEHGFSTSAVLSGGNVIVFMRELMAFDAKTGREAWRTQTVAPSGMNPSGYFHGSFAHTKVGGVDCVIPGNGSVVQASDGKVLFIDPNIAQKQNVSSPVIEGRTFHLMSTWTELLHSVTLPENTAEPFKLSKRELKIPTAQLPHFYLSWHTASPLVHDGLIYLLNNGGVLTVVDANANTIVYQRMLDLDQFDGPNEGSARGHGISPSLAGKKIYFFGNAGASVVIEPGREFKQLAKNKIEGLAMPGTWGERHDRAVACPFFDGKRIYYRTESALYAIGEK